MKVTSLSELDDYLYSSVIAPLKGLNTNLSIQSPIAHEGRAWWLELTRTAVGNFRRNFQRDRAMEQRDYLILLITPNARYIVGKFFIKGRSVELYKKPFKDLNASIVLGRLHHMFDTHKPFTKITIKKESQEIVNRFSPGLVEWDEDDE